MRSLAAEVERVLAPARRQASGGEILEHRAVLEKDSTRTRCSSEVASSGAKITLTESVEEAVNGCDMRLTDV